MQLSNIPGKLVLPFANAGGKSTIPVASQIGITAGAASLTDGFPPLTRTPIAAGGVPPSGLDMNGILYEMSAIIRWANAGGGYPYDGTFATDTNVGGYPKGARIMRSDGTGYWFNTVENNVTDPEGAGAAAAGWVPDYQSGATSVAMSGSSVTLTPNQYGKPLIVITGTLSANLNLIFPPLAQGWTIINNATGGYSITAKTASGSGVTLGTISQIVGDGTNMYAANPDSVQIVNNVATLRNIAPSLSRRIQTRGYYTDGDGGSAQYFPKIGAAPGTYVHNGGTVIVPNGGDGSAAWLMDITYEINVKQFGAKADGTNDSTYINNALSIGYKIKIPKGTYSANIVISTALFDIVGEGMDDTIIVPYSNTLPAIKNMADPGSSNFWMRSRISDVSLQGVGSVGNGFTFGDPAVFVSGNERIGRVDFANVGITGFNKGVFKTCGNIGNTYTNCRIQSNNYNFYAQSDDYASASAATMHTGFDEWNGGAWGYAALANIFIKDRKLGKGGWIFNGVDLEGSPGYCVVALADGTFDAVPDLIFDNCWMEANATGGSITIDGLTGTITGLPRDIYASNIKSAVAKGAYLGKLTLLNGTNFIADKCGADTFTAGIFNLSKDASSTFIADGWTYTTGMSTNLTMAPYATTTDNSSINYTGVMNTVPGAIAAPVKDYAVLLGYSGTAPIVGGGGGYNGTVVSDGMTFNTCSEYVVNAAASRIVPDVVATVGKYYAISYQVRLVSGNNAYVYAANMAAAQLIDHAQWRQYSFVKKATVTGAGFSMNSSGTSSTVRIGAMQIVEFDTAQEAYEYLYRGRVATNSDARSAAYPLSAFTDVGGGGASFNSANVAVTLTNGGYLKICEANFKGDLTKIKVDLLVAFSDLYTGGSLDQLSGFTTLAFASTASTPTQVFGACTVTFKWVQQGSTTIWELQGSVTTGPATAIVLAGLAFIKGK